MSASLKYLLVWTASIAMAAAVLGLLYVLGSHTEVSRSVRNALLGPPEPYGAVIIGSSISRSAFPPEMPDLGPAWPHPVQRHAISSATNEQLLVLAEQALAMSPEVLIIEIGPIVHRRPNVRQRVNTHLGRAAFKVRDGVNVLFNGPVAHLTKQSEYLDTQSDPSQRPRFLKRDLLDFKNSLAAWNEFLERARQTGVRVHFITFPRNENVTNYVTSSIYDNIRTTEKQMASELGVSIFMPAVYWPIQNYADYIHLNRQGRGRYIAELTEWLERQ